MKKDLNKKTAAKRKKEPTDSEFLEISRKREKDLQELDRIAKLLIRRDLELTETKEKREAEVKELEKVKAELEDAKGGLEIKVEELEKINKLMIGRELKMIELKKEIENLEELKKSKGQG